MAVNNQLPTSSEPIGTFGEKSVPVFMGENWYQFFAKLASLLIGGELGFSVESTATATGTTQGTALVMQTEWIEVTTTPLNSGVMLGAFGAGVPSTVFNRGANPLRVYPPVGSQIDTLGVNGAYGLAAGKMQTFSQVEDTEFLSTQLG